MGPHDERLMMASLEGVLGSIQASAEAMSDIVRQTREPTEPPAPPVLGPSLHAERIPRWHFAMLNDTHRNSLLRRALERYVTDGARVLEIGTGTGLLSLMAVRAGAAHVSTCEVDPLLAEIARETVRANGFDDRITVLGRRSTELGPDELGGPFDLIVSEIIDCGLVGEAILPTLDDARCRLLAPGGTILPTSASLYGRVIESPQAVQLNRVEYAEDFDMRLTNLVATPGHFEVDADTLAAEPLSPDLTLGTFDFNKPGPYPPGASVTAPVVRSGTAHALLSWFEVSFGDEVIANAPKGQKTHWSQACTLLDTPVAVSSGDVHPLDVSWRDARLVATLRDTRIGDA